MAKSFVFVQGSEMMKNIERFQKFQGTEQDGDSSMIPRHDWRGFKLFLLESSLKAHFRVFGKLLLGMPYSFEKKYFRFFEKGFLFFRVFKKDKFFSRYFKSKKV